MYLALILAGLATLSICLMARPLANKLRVMDVPDGDRKRHKAPTPLIGGLAITLPMLGAGIFLSSNSSLAGIYIALSMSVAGAFLIGFADDRYDLSPTLRLFLSFVLCLGVLSNDPNLILGILHFTFENSLSLGRWAWPFTLLSVIGFIYAFNMTDGIDGLAIGQALVWSILLLILGNNELSWYLIILSVVLAVTLWFNLTKKLFLGDSGAYALSIIFCVMMIHSHSAVPELKSDIIFVWLLIPVLDCLRLILTRIARQVSPLAPDNNHLHHYLSLLVPSVLVVPMMLAFIACGGLLTILLPDQTIIWLAVSIAVYFAVIGAAARKRRA
jgi:UDP-GlcNAc:undecaprenyl-phosphate GlcNAc-1-phosphate transferase